jgi:fatty-acid desaturase
MYSLRTADGRRRMPTFGEILRQYWRTIDFLADRRCALRALLETYHLVTFGLCVIFLAKYASVTTLIVYAATTLVFVNVFNTIWYHRYCSHRAFRFSHPAFPTLLLWFNPLGIREEIYAIMHNVHHAHADGEDDPHGPHLGAIGSYLAGGEFEIDSDVTAAQYQRITRRLAHLHVPFASLDSFRRWRSIEWIPHYLARWSFANAFWAGVWYVAGGIPLVFAWWAAVFTLTALVRSFNGIGHVHSPDALVAGWDFDRGTRARNQRLYGYLASEWHNNHHRFPSSANCAFLPGQIDVCFLIVKTLYRCRIVSQYNDRTSRFFQVYRDDLAAHGVVVEHRGDGNL